MDRGRPAERALYLLSHAVKKSQKLSGLRRMSFLARFGH